MYKEYYQKYFWGLFMRIFPCAHMKNFSPVTAIKFCIQTNITLHDHCNKPLRMTETGLTDLVSINT